VTRPTFTGAPAAGAADDAAAAAEVVAAAAAVVAAANALLDGVLGLFFELEQAEARIVSATVDPIKAIRRR